MISSFIFKALLLVSIQNAASCCVSPMNPMNPYGNISPFFQCFVPMFFCPFESFLHMFCGQRGLSAARHFCLPQLSLLNSSRSIRVWTRACRISCLSLRSSVLRGRRGRCLFSLEPCVMNVVRLGFMWTANVYPPCILSSSLHVPDSLECRVPAPSR